MIGRWRWPWGRRPTPAALTPATHALVRAAAALALESYDRTLALAIATDPVGPLVAHTDLYRQLVLGPTRELLLGLALVPRAERDAAVGPLLVAVFAQLLDRDLQALRQRQEVPW